MYKISNWNIDRPSPNSKKTKLVICKIIEEDSDIIVLTETSNAIDLSDKYPFSISTLSYERTPTEQWVTIWSKWRHLYRFAIFILNCDLGRIQTFNLLSRNQVRYSVAPRGLIVNYQ